MRCFLEAVRTSSCPGQEDAARRSPGRGAGLLSVCSTLLGPSLAKGQKQFFKPSPLDICSDRSRPGHPRAEMGPTAKLVFLLPLPPQPDPVCPLPPIPCGSCLAQSKSNPLILHNTARTYPWTSSSPMLTPHPSTPASSVSLLPFKHARHIPTPGLLHWLIRLLLCCSPGILLAPSLNTGFCPNIF